ncbi:uncharacterized protein J4E92_010110 [Alternaria infectoria]|uniref:uncharacterized protein n=1 Tax=Alternaria infectoria TaxID=45303 RepID=UPI0022208DC4|nr:uncharacterized protein J4E92_010110 [Alternaria infectoria]KAI4912259.1 hypothetical protein J4E92_010110 [Alternaria infectoria]
MTSILDIPGSTPPNRFNTLVQEALTARDYPLLFGHSVEKIIDAIAASYDADQAVWELWDAIFNNVVFCPPPYNSHLTLLDAIRAQPPTKPKVLRLCRDTEEDGQIHWSKLPGFEWYWRDAHDILQGWRNWDGVRDPDPEKGISESQLSVPGDQLYLRMCIFSVELMKHDEQAGVGDPMMVFWACRDGIEREHEAPPMLEIKENGISLEQVRALDIRIAAMWLRDGGWALWNADHAKLREHWGPAMDDPTELWPREDGLTPERWGLWEKRLWDLSTDEESLDEDTRAMVKEAYEVVEAILDTGE